MSWSFQRDLALPLGQALMESLWLYAAIVVAGALVPMPLRLDLTVLVGLPCCVALAGKGSTRVPLPPALRVVLQLGLGLLVLAVWLRWVLGAGAPWTLDAWVILLTEPWQLRPSVSPPFLVFAWSLGLYLTCRGLLFGAQHQTGRRVGRWMLVGASGLLFLCTSLALRGVSLAQVPSDQLRGIMLGYFVVGLSTMALAHRQETSGGNGLRPKLSLAWLLAVGGPTLVVVSVGMLLGSSVGTMHAALEMTWAVLGWVMQVVESFLALVLGALAWLLRFLGELFSASRAGSTGKGGGCAPDSLPLETTQTQPPRIATPEISVDLMLPLAIAVVVLAVVAYMLVLSSGRTSASGPTSEEASSAWSWALWQRQARDAWRGLLNRLRTRTVRAVSRLAALRPKRREELHDIRPIYRALLRWAAEQGYPRPPAATPHEFAATLAPLADDEQHLAVITRYYVQARYGTAALDEAALGEARRHVEALLASSLSAS
jgi:hypothetical protein